MNPYPLSQQAFKHEEEHFFLQYSVKTWSQVFLGIQKSISTLAYVFISQFSLLQI